jgi:antagonist of KipI
LRVWRGPQWDEFTEADRTFFFNRAWTVSSQSDRVGYRLTGEPLVTPHRSLLSEPVLPGTIQVPENGQPIVTMRDGPTVGGYAKLGLVEPTDLSWLAQCRPGQAVRFQLIS